MNAEQYLSTHWGPRSVWTHLKNRKHQTRLARCAGLVRGESFCDVGCAFGHSTEIMAGFRPGNWIGVEFSSAAILKVQELFPSRPCLFYESIDALETTPSAVDSAVCSEVIEHVENDVALVRGVMALVRFRAVFTTPIKWVKDPGHLRLYSVGDLTRLFEPWPHKILIEPPFFYVVADKEGVLE